MRVSHLLGSALFVLFLCAATAQTPPADRTAWLSVGPDGGDVRSLSYDPANPARILLGTSAGQIYQSEDSGKTWRRFVRIGKGSDYVVDHIVFDAAHPGTIYVAAWTLEHEGGAVFKSTDDGHTWEALKGMEGKSVRAMAIAPSDANTLVAGALDGVFRTRNGGQTWEQISPAGSAEIKNVESIAVDPANPDVIYAGTWHLPWKTNDGGRTWHNIKNGVIDDSDVFSIIIDPRQPQVVYASACSGIYKSETAGELFHKIQGIPFSARRTRVLKQDPTNSDVVYAGTTEGLWKTSDAGRTWRRITSTELIVNDVLVDVNNPQHVLLGTDRSGVLASNNAGVTFEASNLGFAHRQVAALTVDPEDQNTLYAGLVNDKEYGGVFISHDRGAHWKQINAGLDGRDVFALRKTGAHLLAGTSNGVFELERAGGEEHWRMLDRIVNEKAVTLRKATRRHKAIVRREIKTGLLKSRITDIEVHDKEWIAASRQGLFTSANLGRTWQGGPLLGHSDFTLVRTSPKLVTAAGRNFLLTSIDDGQTWQESPLPKVITSINDVAVSAEGNIWLACREGLYRSVDLGNSWERLLKLPVVNLASVFYDPASKTLLVTAFDSTQLFSSKDNGDSWQGRDSGWLLRNVTETGNSLVGSTAFDGVVLEQTTRPPETAQAAVAGGSQ